MLNLIITGASYGASYLFPAGRSIKLARDAMKVTNSTNPLLLSKNVTLMVVDCCCPPPVKLAAHCLSVGALIGCSIISPNPITVGSAIHSITEIYENC